jgi:uncharacterized protein involved in response to NO
MTRPVIKPAGDSNMTTGSDQRRRYSGPAFFGNGFRPFFLGGGLYAFIAISGWILYLTGLAQLPDAVTDNPAFNPIAWHAHEMIFGYVGAVLGGFILTAVPNWTGRLPICGLPLASLAGLWLAGRLGVALCQLGIISPVAGACLDLLYMTVLIIAVALEIIAGRNWRNLPVIGILTAFDLANLISYLPLWSSIDSSLGQQLALATLAAAITLIGGRIVPSFTRNWLMKNGGEPFPAPFGMIDRLAILTTVTGMSIWAFLPAHMLTGVLLALAGVFQALRLSRWQGLRTFGEPLLIILHIGYGWLTVALFALSLAIFAPTVLNFSSALHALTAGAIGVMTTAVMTRAILGHTGRALTADKGTIAIYILVNLGAILRVAAVHLPFNYNNLALSGLLWGAGLMIFSVKYGRYLLTPKAKT